MTTEEARALVMGEVQRTNSANSANSALAAPSRPVMGAAAFHGIAGEFIELVRHETEADPAAILVQLLVAVGTALGRGPYIEVDLDVHHSNLFCCLVGATARGRKGTALKAARRLIEPAGPDLRIVKGASSGEGLVFAVRDGDDKEDGDVGVDDKRLLDVETEFASVLKRAAQPGNTLSQTYRDAWDGEDLGSLTKFNRTTATAPHISLIGHVTQADLEKHFSQVDANNGFGNRILWVHSEREHYLSRGGQSLDQKTLDGLVGRLSRALEAGRSVGRVERSKDAWRRWDEFYRPWEESIPDTLVGSMLARGSAHVTRLSMIYAVLDGSAEIQPVHHEAAAAVWMYCAETVRQIFGGRVGDPDADRILERLRIAGDRGLTRTEVNESFSGHKSKPEIDHILSRLAGAGLAHSKTTPTAGAPRTTWFYGAESEE